MKLSDKTRRLLETSANIGIVVVTLAILWNFIWPRIHPKRQASDPVVGSSVSLGGVDWNKNGSTLLMVLQEGCKYCEQSVPFYKSLHAQRSGSQPRMLTVVPGEAASVTRYLSEQGVPTDGIINASLSDVNVSGTPTLLLVDNTGHIKNVWVGKLDANREKEVMQKAFGIP
ncbi:MAG TPA: hypothetical protein DC054_10375 [Blastocatellia bacterium]|nr:hypothetical protein [Blastocatellia bacterium]